MDKKLDKSTGVEFRLISCGMWHRFIVDGGLNGWEIFNNREDADAYYESERLLMVRHIAAEALKADMRQDIATIKMWYCGQHQADRGM
jgi:hypothetical protein